MLEYPVTWSALCTNGIPRKRERSAAPEPHQVDGPEFLRRAQANNPRYTLCLGINGPRQRSATWSGCSSHAL